MVLELTPDVSHTNQIDTWDRTYMSELDLVIMHKKVGNLNHRCEKTTYLQFLSLTYGYTERCFSVIQTVMSKSKERDTSRSEFDII